MKERLQQLWPNIKFAWRCMGDNLRIFGEMDEVRALKRAFRVFWWRLGDVFALIGRLLWAWFLNTRMVRSARAWWQRTKKAVWELPQYQFLRRFFGRLKANVWLRWLVFGGFALLISLPWCLSDTTRETYTYLVVTDEITEVVDGYPDFTYESDTLRVMEDTGGDAQIILSAGQDVLIRHGDELLSVESYTETVQNLLERYDIHVGKDEMIGVNNTGLKTLIHISDELRCRRRETTVDTYKTKVLYDYLLPYGEHVILQEGTPGTTTDTYDDVYRSGEMVNTVLVDRSDSTAQAQIIVYGRLVKEVEQDDRIERDVPYGGGRSGGYLVFKSGYSMTYYDKLVCNSTAYYSGGEKGAAWTTATGHAVGLGIIAADPKTFPYPSRMFIQSYGMGQVEDTGGMKGNVIDVWFPSYADCVSWGRRNVTVWLLD